MKIKLLIIMSMICIGFFISPVLSYDLHAVSVVDGGTQFISVPVDKEVVYSYSSSVPQNGVLVFSLPDNDTYMVNNNNVIEMVTVRKSQEPKNIIEVILGWL